MTRNFQIRVASASDQRALLDLLRRCPIAGSMELVLDRQPDFFALSRLQGEQSTVYLAEDSEGRLLGSVMFTERPEKWGDRTYKVVRLSDLRTDPRYRQSGVAAAFVELYQKLLIDGVYDYGRSEILEGNDVPFRVHQVAREVLSFENRGRAEIYQLFPLWKLSVPTDLKLRPATLGDLPALSLLLETSYSERVGRPDFQLPALQAALERDPSFAIETFWLAEDASGRLLACVGAWDQHALRQTIVSRFATSARWLRQGLQVARLLWPLPPIPMEGQALRYLYLRWPTCLPGEERALRALIRKVLNEARSRKTYHFVGIAFHEGDSLRSCLDGIIKIKSRMHIILHWARKTRGSSDSLERTPLTFVDPVLL